MEVYLIRHTQVAVGKDVCYGQTDVALAETFSQELGVLKNKLPETINNYFSSPLSRCKTLAEGLTNKEIEFSDALLEMNFGDWENKRWNDLNQDELTTWMEDFVNQKVPNGENLLDLAKRVEIFLDDLRCQSFENAVIVTHSGVIRCIWSLVLEIPLANIFKFPVDFGQVIVLHLNENKLFDSIKAIK